VDPDQKPRVEEGSAAGTTSPATLEGKQSVALSISPSPLERPEYRGRGVCTDAGAENALSEGSITGSFTTPPPHSEIYREGLSDTLRDAIILVHRGAGVLQNWREATLIPLVRRPGGPHRPLRRHWPRWLFFSAQNLSLLGMVWRSASSVDDAIVVVEKVVERLACRENRGRERGGGRAGQDEVTGTVVAVALVGLCARVVPGTFLAASRPFFRQFAVTISVSTVIIRFNSLNASAGPWRPSCSRRTPPARPDSPALNLGSAGFFRGVKTGVWDGTSRTRERGRLLRFSWSYCCLRRHSLGC